MRRLALLGILAFPCSGCDAVQKFMGGDTGAPNVASSSPERLSLWVFSLVEQSLQRYLSDCKSYPDQKVGLNALISDPGTCKGWRGPYLDAPLVKDRWETPFFYSGGVDAYELRSAGPDRKAGTADDLVRKSKP